MNITEIYSLKSKIRLIKCHRKHTAALCRKNTNLNPKMRVPLKREKKCILWILLTVNLFQITTEEDSFPVVPRETRNDIDPPSPFFQLPETTNTYIIINYLSTATYLKVFILNHPCPSMVYQSQKKRRHQRWDGGGGHWAIKRRDIIYFAVLYSLGPYKSPLLSSLTREKRSINLQGHKKRKSSILHKGRPVPARPAYAFANYLKNNSNSPSLWKIKRKTNGWNIYR